MGVQQEGGAWGLAEGQKPSRQEAEEKDLRSQALGRSKQALGRSKLALLQECSSRTVAEGSDLTPHLPGGHN